MLNSQFTNDTSSSSGNDNQYTFIISIYYNVHTADKGTYFVTHRIVSNDVLSHIIFEFLDVLLSTLRLLGPRTILIVHCSVTVA